MPSRKPVASVAFGALGVVFGDIGTSPLYAIRQVFHDSPALARDPEAVLGFLSLVLWSVVLVVCVKYVGLIMRADHDGEGGTLAMLGLIHARSEPSQNQSRGEVPPDGRPSGGEAGRTAAGPGNGHEAPASPQPPPRWRDRPDALTLLVLFASALLFGDGMVTPAISVLSAVEGLDVATPVFKPVVLPLAVAILVGLFALQAVGTERVAKLFAPVMLAWFAIIGILGLLATLHHLSVLAAWNPVYGARFLAGHGWTGFATLGAVVLAFSGVEALFADMGQFGRRPITLAWYCVVLPGLLLNYLGQGGHVLDDPASGSEPFFSLVPHWALFPMVALSTAAAVIASQALISGMFSLMRQAVNMGYAPRYAVRHTAPAAAGQVYVPAINGVLAVGCIAIVLAFRSSDALGNAYGLAVIGTMTITSVVYLVVLRRVREWSLAASLCVAGCFLAIEVAFLLANLAKLLSGAWVPLAIALVVFGVLAAWTDGRARYRRAIAAWGMPVTRFQDLMRDGRDAGKETAVFLTDDLDVVPLVGHIPWLLEDVCAKRVLLLRVGGTGTPWVPEGDRVDVERTSGRLVRATIHYGFMQAPNVGAVLAGILPRGWNDPVFYLAQPVVGQGGNILSRWRRRSFLFLGNTGLSPVEFFHLPPQQTLAVGANIEL